MKREEASAFTSKCFRGELASCSYACPFRLDIRSLLDKVSKGRWTAAYRVLRDATAFPVIVSALCDEPCRDHCQRTLLGDEALSVRDLECACLRFAKDRQARFYAIPPKDSRIAVVGAGPAGLSCALSLAQKRFPVTVFEKERSWGGVLRSHPRFAEFDADIALQFSAVEASFRFAAPVKSLDDVADFEIVYVATGAGADAFGLRDGWDRDLLTTPLPGVFAGGMTCGVTLLQGIAQGARASKVIEAFVQTGNMVRPPDDDDEAKRNRYVKHEGATRAPRVRAVDPSGYSEDEAKLEAARCLQCDCDACLAACEMLRRYRKDPHTIATQVHADMESNPPFSPRTITREVYSCNICRHCASVCPENVDIGALLRFSRAARTAAGVHPGALHDFWLREMDFATSEGAFASPPKGKDACDYAFFPGCQLGASNPDHALLSYGFLSENHDAGILLNCCGAPAYWAGDDARMATHVQVLRRSWEDLGQPTLVFACATCATLFRQFLPEIPGISLYELLAISQKTIPTAPLSEVAVFDPCAARNDHGMKSSVRTLARKMGVTLEKLEEPNRCCGHGGHIRTANPDLFAEVVQHRAEASGRTYVVYCANCKEVLVSGAKECAHILDLIFGLDSDDPLPSLQQKRENALTVKRELMKETRDLDFEPESSPWDQLTLVISDELQRELDRKLIASSALKEAIWSAEQSADKFVDEVGDECIASMVKPFITYWVQYREIAPRRYAISNAYYHRMRFEPEE